MKLHTGDNIIMLSGKDRGKKGKIVRVFASEGQVLIEGLNMIKRHTRARKQGQKGQVISKERPVNASSVAIVCKSCGKPTRIGFQLEASTKLRICKKCKAVL